jgi:uncharacterized membrane protein YphA (DoxX/SURF4 family)
MHYIIRSLIQIGILKKDLDYHLLRALMVIIYLFFGYQKWFDYEAQALIPYVRHGPLIFRMYAVFGIRRATYFLGISEWLFGALLLAGFWNKKLGILGALGSCFSMIATSTIIPLHAGRLGRFGRRVPCNDREGCIPDEGSGSLWCFCVFTAAGCHQSVACEENIIRLNRGTSAGSVYPLE